MIQKQPNDMIIQKPTVENLVQLSTHEFFSVYAQLRKCLLSEINLENSSELEGNQLADACERIVKLEPDNKKKFDFLKGFIPLYRRLHSAKLTAKQTEKGYNRYEVAFN